MTPRVRAEIEKHKWMARVWRKVEKDPEGHWLWRGSRYTDRHGFYTYGITQLHNARQPVHRVIWTWLVGPLPDRGQLVNTCGNTLCVNPAHWESVDHWTHAKCRK